jgi:hypothetical protein
MAAAAAACNEAILGIEPRRATNWLVTCISDGQEEEEEKGEGLQADTRRRHHVSAGRGGGGGGGGET